MAALSDQLLTVTILLYTLAMLGYAVEYAFGIRGVVATSAVREPALIGGPSGYAPSAGEEPWGSPDDPAGYVSPADPGPTGVADRPGRASVAGKVAVALTVAGVLAHIASVVLRGVDAHRMPLGNMYEFVVFGCLVAMAIWSGIAIRRPALRPLGLFASLIIVLLLGIAATTLYVKVTPLVPALNSYWLAIHVTAASISSGVFMVGFVPAAMFLIRRRWEQTGSQSFPVSLGARMPASDTLERLTFRIHVFAFPIWTFAGISGAIWAEAAWGRYWGWDPKETWLFISWVVYAMYLHARATPSIRRTTVTWIAVLGWVTMLVNLFGINLVVSGLHSYAGV
ncbi:c-type cytochrome biogenesis protein CcsB [Longispora fulva]|uniref:Cytochrome c-type biogenesis protein CcsB n=1 Tax=Longispora fulva TaxID=619741 RepID=A0A8J7KZ16_9ACTN|nr:c-type cytochrome biogenesis protein CcsB [Longispora fulva]MBG6139967.1 cytochrome c-type biogenesis protein CcsB [Longispora fulva]GIG57648.1 c-type cytochrome biogenesis protein CcsB [Longispora fulva]